MSSEDLLPGDLVQLGTHSNYCFADLILVSGRVIANESLLTGSVAE